MFRALIFALLLSPLYGESARKSFLPDFDDGTISFYFDNDIFSGTDRDYTNGWRLAWISGERQNLRDIAPIQRYLDYLSGSNNSTGILKNLWGFDDVSNLKYQYGMAVTQHMFTPESEDPIPPVGERPYAGWLGLGFSLHVSNEERIHSVEFTVGTIGPDSFAEETQNSVHDFRDIERFEGWDTQIPNEFTFNIDLNTKRRFTYLEPYDLPMLPLSFNGFTEVGSSLGTYRTDVRFGWHMQIGYNVPVDFSDPRLSPTANAISWNDDTIPTNFSAYLILGAKVTAVFHDATLDGPSFRDFDTGIESEKFVGEYFYGFGIHYKDVEFSYVQTIRSKEYTTQSNHQEFGSLAFRIRY